MAGGKDPLLLKKAIVTGSIVNEKGTEIVPKFVGKHTWAGGTATSAATVPGVKAGDLVIATINTKPTQAAYLRGVVATANTITFELSAANTDNDAVIAYQVFRP